MLLHVLLDLGLLIFYAGITFILDDSVFIEFRFRSPNQVNKSLKKNSLVFGLIKGFINLNIYQ